VVSTDPQLVKQAIDTGRRFKIAIWDALIVEAARAGGCRRVLSEDLHTGQNYDGVTVENPFA
jgi:predicted nucleic acid-binding protein